MSLFAMPSLGSDMEAGKLVEWLVKPGDTVSRGDIVAVVETQKGAIEIEIFQDGVVRSLEAELGQTLPVGAPLAQIAAPGEEAPPAAEPSPARQAEMAAASPAPAQPDRGGTAAGIAPPRPASAAPAAAAEGPRAPSGRPATGPVGLAEATPARPASGPPARAAETADQPMPRAEAAQRVSPAARALAAERGVHLGGLAGTGPGGAIVLSDVERAASGPAAAAPRAGLDLDAMRQAIAAAMARSKREIPHYYLAHAVDLQSATDWLHERNAGRDPQARLLMGALFVKAAALAAAEVPEMSGHYQDGTFRPGGAVHAGVAVALRGGGLVAPAIRDAAGRSLDGIMAAMRDLVARARAGRLRSSEMTDGTITISALGEKGVDAMTGVIYPPQVALVGFGAPRPVPRVVGGRVEPRICVAVTLAADHRVSDGRRGARFLQHLDTFLGEPDRL